MSGMFDDLHEVIEQREVLSRQIIAALAHLPRDLAIATVLGWNSLDELRDMIPTICKQEPQA